MDINEFSEKLFKSCYTAADLHHRINLLQQYLSQVLFTPKPSSADKYLADNGGNDADLAFFSANREAMSTCFNPENIYPAIETIKASAAQLPVVRVFIPVAFDDKTIAGLGESVREIFGRNVLMEVSLDPWVNGGCAIIWKGTYYDFSFRYFLNKRRSEIREILDGYVKKLQSGMTA